MPFLNKVMLIGRLTSDPKQSQPLSNGSHLMTFTLAVGRSRKNSQTGQWENDPNPLYIDCKSFVKQEDTMQQLLKSCTKGTLVYVEGTLNYETWLDKSGNRKSKHTLAIKDLQLLGTRTATTTAAVAPQPDVDSSSESDQGYDF